MIGKNELQILSRQTGIGMYYQEKDYLLNIFLSSFYKAEKQAVFKGGTCLKFAYNYQRFSEDLDFQTLMPAEKMKELVIKNIGRFNDFGIEFEIKREEVFKDSYSLLACFKGPLYAGKLSENSIQIDIGLRGKILLKPKWAQIISKYSDMPNYFVLVMQEQEILAEKIGAMFSRKKPRDMFDVWCMLGKGVEINKKILDIKLSEKNLKKIDLEFPGRKKYEDDLRNLLPSVPDFEQVRDEVLKKINAFV